jgi:hypothetical protein
VIPAVPGWPSCTAARYGPYGRADEMSANLCSFKLVTQALLPNLRHTTDHARHSSHDLSAAADGHARCIRLSGCSRKILNYLQPVSNRDGGRVPSACMKHKQVAGSVSPLWIYIACRGGGWSQIPMRGTTLMSMENLSEGGGRNTDESAFRETI